MSHIIWKDIDSRTIKGLIISELPPITKPKMRVQETKIDGVDGSIIEELGYESYDKSMKIGLSYNYDIDEIVKYFSGESNIVFSNEPDKYYKVRILDQIDYERLLRFKEAIVKFRVQPFKYLYQEHKLVFDNLEDSIIVVNKGLENSKPIITITGTGTIEFRLEDMSIFKYTFPEGEDTVIIDSEKQDAYLGSELRNRNMIGEFPVFKSGKNKISFDGTITKLEVEPKSRWI